MDNPDLKPFNTNYSSSSNNINDNNDNNRMYAHHISSPIPVSRPVQEEEDGATSGSAVLLVNGNVKKESRISEQIAGNSWELEGEVCEEGLEQFSTQNEVSADATDQSKSLTAVLQTAVRIIKYTLLCLTTTCLGGFSYHYCFQDLDGNQEPQNQIIIHNTTAQSLSLKWYILARENFRFML